MTPNKQTAAKKTKPKKSTTGSTQTSRTKTPTKTDKPIIADEQDIRLGVGETETALLKWVKAHPGKPTIAVCNAVSEGRDVAWRTARQAINRLEFKGHIRRKERPGPPRHMAVYITDAGRAALTDTSLRTLSEFRTSGEVGARIEEADKQGLPILPPPEEAEDMIHMQDPIASAAAQAVKAALATHSQRVHVIKDECETDPVKWIEVARPKIETKTHGLEPYDPTPFQKAIIRKTIEQYRFIGEKSRQIGMTTAVQVAAAWMTLYRVPFHGHIVANKEKVAIERVLKIAKRALETCIMPDEMRARLYLGTDHTSIIKYRGKRSDNYLQAHSASSDAGHSFDGNWVVLEEFSRMPEAETIYMGMQGMLDEGGTGFAIVSTHDGYGTFFHHICENADDMGFERIKATWKVHPGRDEAWKKRKIAEMGLDQFLEAHECVPMLVGEAAIDWPKLAEMARKHEWLGGMYTPGHKYLIGIDQASGGDCDTVSCVIDITCRPAQVVHLKLFKSNASDDETRTQQKIAFMEEVPVAWPATRVFIDATNEVGTASLAQIPKKVCVKITDNRGGIVKEDYNTHDKVRELKVPRSRLVDHAITCMERGRVIVHEKQFPRLYEAFKSITKGHRYKGTSKKQGGRNLDEFDAFILACQGLTYNAPSSDNVRTAIGIDGDKGFRSLREEKW